MEGVLAATRIQLTTTTVAQLSAFVDDQSLTTFVARTTPPWSWLPRLLGAGAVTLGRNVTFREGRYNETTPRGLALIAHECVHVRQYREMGAVSFLLAYGRGAIQSRFVHARHPLEIEANLLQKRVREALEPAQS